MKQMSRNEHIPYEGNLWDVPFRGKDGVKLP